MNHALNSLRRGLSPPRLTPSQLTTVSRQWRDQRLASGEVLWRVGQRCDSLALLSSGELAVEISGVQVGRIRAGEILGEGAVIPGQRHGCTLRALGQARLTVLEEPRLSRWLGCDPVGAEASLDLCLLSVSRRARLVAREAERSAGERRGLVERLDVIFPLQTSLRSAIAAVSEPPQSQALLMELPHLAPLQLEERLVLARAFEPRRFLAAEVVAFPGELGEVACLLVAGSLLTMSRGVSGAAVFSCELSPGDLFGAQCLVEPLRREVSLIGNAPGWLYTLGRESLAGLPLKLRLRVKRCLLDGLAGQLREASRLVAWGRRSQARVQPKLASA